MKKIISWNVNGIRAVAKKGFLEFLQSSNPDILCIQETKAEESQLDQELAHPKGYYTYWNSAVKKGYSGTAIYSKKPLQVEHMKIERFDNEGRVLIAHEKDWTLINAYFPNSQDQGKRLEYKLDFCKSMLTLCNKLTKDGKRVLLCGDYNIAHTEIDLARPKENEKSPGYLPEERAWMDKFINKNNYIDTFRMYCKDPFHYTWWSYRSAARERNIGWRIDYFCSNEKALDIIKNSIILDDVMGSDHCPIELTVK